MDVQLYIFINGAWQEYNPKPAAHSHTISEVEGLSVALNAKAPAAQVVRATTESKNILGTSEEVFNISEKKVWFNKGALFYGTAAAAGLVTRGISGASQTGSAKDHLYINYDGNNTLSRQLVLGAGSIGTNRGHGIYDYSAVRGDAFIAYLTNTLGSYAKESDISAWAKKTSLAIGDIPTGTTGSTVALGNHTHSAATTSAAGFMSSADKTKLNSIATGAQKNSTITKAEIETSLGFTPENEANKITSIRSSGATDTAYVSELGVKTYVDGLIGSVYRPAGDWNAYTNAPALANNTPANAGKVYRVSVAGTRFGFTFAVGDKLAFNESGVISKWDNVDDVVSVNGETGAVNLTAAKVGARSNTWTPTWNQVTSKPTTFTPSSHNHTISEVEGLQTALDNKANSSHTHEYSEILGRPNIPTDLNQLTNTPGFIRWTEVWSGSSTNLNSYTDDWYQATVPFNSYSGKRIAIEVQYIGHTSKIIFGVLGSSRITAASDSISRGIGWSYFDGTNLRVKTLYAYTPTGTSTAIYVGYLKSLLGSFSGTTIEWSTSHSETLYMRKIWVIE